MYINEKLIYVSIISRKQETFSFKDYNDKIPLFTAENTYQQLSLNVFDIGLVVRILVVVVLMIKDIQKATLKS